jgi:hypothetical protein
MDAGVCVDGTFFFREPNPEEPTVDGGGDRMSENVNCPKCGNRAPKKFAGVKENAKPTEILTGAGPAAAIGLLIGGPIGLAVGVGVGAGIGYLRGALLQCEKCNATFRV